MSELIDNRAHRVRTLKEIIKHLHSGQPAEEVKDRLKEMVRETDYSEIVAMEEQLMAEGMPVEEVQCMCDLHSQVTRDILVQLPAKGVPPGIRADAGLPVFGWMTSPRGCRPTSRPRLKRAKTAARPW